MSTYIVYVKSPTDSIVHDKRFEAESYEDLQEKVISYFQYMKDSVVVRVEEVTRLFGEMDFHFGNNYINEVK